MSFGGGIFNNFLPKVITLIFAVMTWFYVADVVDRDSFSQRKESLEETLAKYNFSIKRIRVRPVFTGESPAGYRAVIDKVIIDPPVISIFGPDEILTEVDEFDTDAIDVSEYTRSVKLRVDLHSKVDALRTQNKWVDVFLPVEKIKS